MHLPRLCKVFVVERCSAQQRQPPWILHFLPAVLKPCHLLVFRECGECLDQLGYQFASKLRRHLGVDATHRGVQGNRQSFPAFARECAYEPPAQLLQILVSLFSERLRILPGAQRENRHGREEEIADWKQRIFEQLVHFLKTSVSMWRADQAEHALPVGTVILATQALRQLASRLLGSEITQSLESSLLGIIPDIPAGPSAPLELLPNLHELRVLPCRIWRGDLQIYYIGRQFY